MKRCDKATASDATRLKMREALLPADKMECTEEG
jgi:hypothetical protein